MVGSGPLQLKQKLCESAVQFILCGAGQDVQQQGVHGTLPIVHRRPLAALLCNTNTYVCHSNGSNK